MLVVERHACVFAKATRAAGVVLVVLPHDRVKKLVRSFRGEEGGREGQSAADAVCASERGALT